MGQITHTQKVGHSPTDFIFDVRPPGNCGTADAYCYAIDTYEFTPSMPDDDLPGTATVTMSPVPLPAGGVLLLTGLFGIATLRRRKKQA